MTFKKRIAFALCCWFSLISLSSAAQLNTLRYWSGNSGYMLGIEEIPGAGIYALLETDPTAVLVKMNEKGLVEWGKEFTEEYRYMFVSPDQHIYLLSDDTNLPSLVKLGLNGDLLWEKEYSLGALAQGNTAADMGPMGDVFLAVHGAGQFGGFDTRVIKIDSSGGVQWYQKTNSDCMLAGVVGAMDGGCYVGYNGLNPQSSATYREGEIHRLLPAGGLAWARKYDRSHTGLEQMELTADGILNAVVGPWVDYPSTRYYEVHRWDSLGNTLNGLSIGDSTAREQEFVITSINKTPNNGIVIGGQLLEFDSPPIYNLDGVVYYIGQYAGTSYGRRDLSPSFMQDNLDKKIGAVAGLSGFGIGGLVYAGSVGDNGSAVTPRNWIGLIADKDSACSGTYLPIMGLNGPAPTTATAPVYTALGHSSMSNPPAVQAYFVQDSLVCLECLENFSAYFSASINGLTATFADSSNGGQLTWDFGDGATGTGSNPTHTYATEGTYNVCLTASGLCDTATTCQVVGLVLQREESLPGMVTVFPNPTSDHLNVEFSEVQPKLEWRLFDVHGKLVLGESAKGVRELKLNVAALPSGAYFLELRNQGRRRGETIRVQH